jgi:proteasome lid subunit RPN8/RPN11/tetratricopeptide (TPR) repeat protein
VSDEVQNERLDDGADDGLDISLGSVQQASARRREPPDRRAGLLVTAVGAVRSGAPRIYMTRRAADAIERHAQSETARELGGVLLGGHYEGRDGEFVEIEDALPAEGAESHAARITFTHETWARVAEAVDARPDRLQIVGWYHTHPGFGIFLSHHDLFIHQNFFAEPWQVALVVDPVAGTRGFFHWQDGRVRPMAGWYLYASEEEGEALSGLVDLLRSGRRGAPAPVGPSAGLADRVPAALYQRLEALRSYAVLAAIVGLLVLGLNLILLMNLMRVGQEVQEVARLAERASPLGRGRDLLGAGRLEQAVEELNLARQDESARATAHAFLGQAYARLNRYNEAREATMEAARIDPARFGGEAARFLADDLRRGTAWTVAAGRTVDSAVRRDGLRKATDEPDAAAVRIAIEALEDHQADVVLAAIQVLRATPGPFAADALSSFVQRTCERARVQHDGRNYAKSAELMALARAAAPTDPVVEDGYWCCRYKGGLVDLDQVLREAGCYQRVAEDVLAGSDEGRRRRVIEVLAKRRDDWSARAFAKALADPAPSLRTRAVDGLAEMGAAGSARAALDLARALEATKDEAFRRECIAALGRTKQAAAAPVLAAVVRSTTFDEDTRVRAVTALAQVGSGAPEAFRTLVLPDGHARVAKAIERETPVATANALYDAAWGLYDARRLDEAVRTLESIQVSVSGARSVRWLRRLIRRAAADAASSRPAAAA